MLYHIPSFPSPLFLTFFESLPRRVFFSDLWNPGGVWWYFKSKFWPLHTRTEMSDLSDKLTLKFHNLNCKKIFFPRKKRYTRYILSILVPNQKFQKPILYITIFLADDEAQLSLGFRFHIKSQASFQSLLQQQPKKRFQKSPEMTCFSVIKNPDGAFGFVVSHFISVFTTNCSVYFFFSLSFILCYFLFTSAFDSNWQFFKPKRHLLKPELVTLARSCYSHTVKFQNIFFLSRAKKHFDIVLFFCSGWYHQQYIFIFVFEISSPQKSFV